MRCVSVAMVVAVALLVIAGVANPILSDVVLPSLPMTVSLRPVNIPSQYGWVDMEVVVDPTRVSCEEVVVTVTAKDGLRYDGQPQIRVPRLPEGVYRTQFRVFVAPDTSNGISVKADCGGAYLHATNFFITYGDSLVYLPHFAEATERARPIFRHPRSGNIRPGEHPHYDSLQGIPAPPTPDTDRLEYTRQLLECIKGFPDGTLYDVFLELDQSQKVALAPQMMDTLVPTETANQYLTRADRALLESLCAAGVWVTFKRIYLLTDPTRIAPLVVKSVETGRPVDSAFNAMRREMEKTPLLDSAMESIRLNRCVFTRHRGEYEFRFSHLEEPPKLPELPMTLDSLRRLEESPLTRANVEVFKIDSFAYRRQRGESKFRKTRLITDGVAEYWRFYDSLNAVHDEKYWYILDLTDPQKYDSAQQIVTSLSPTDRPGFYRAFINRGTVMDLAKQEIRCEREHSGTDQKTEQETPARSTDENEDGYPRGQPDVGSEVLFHEDFEDGLSDMIWHREDVSPFSGLDYWGLSSLKAVPPGNYSVWCSGEGNMIDGDRYDLMMTSYMTLIQLIDISSYTNASVSYWVDYDTEPYRDRSEMLYSHDRVTWYQTIELSGNSGGWNQHVVNVEGDVLYIRFSFLSDGDKCDYRGVYVDDIYITGDPIPNLTYYTPPGWDNPIVPSSVTGTNTEGSLYAGVPTYVDWAVVNNGEGAAGPFWVTLAQDGSTYLDSTLISGLAPGEYYVLEDASYTIEEGIHALGIQIDPQQEIDEADDSIEDNQFLDVWNWSEQAIAFSGQLLYWDMHPPQTQKPMRGVRIDMWDHDLVSDDDSLASDITDDSGRFEMEPVINDEGIIGSDPLDIFFKVYAENEAAYVTKTYNGDIFTFQTECVSNVSSGTHDTVRVVAAPHRDTSGAFYVADIALDMNRWWSGVSGHGPLSSIQLWLTSSQTGTGYIKEWDVIRIENSADPNRWWPQTYVPDIIRHEYTHKIQWELAFFDSPNGTAGHGWCTRTDPDTATTEGFAYFLPLAVNGSPRFEAYRDSFQDTLWMDAETGLSGLNSLVDWTGSCTNMGAAADAPVAGIFWDIYDTADDDYTTFRSFPITDSLPERDGLGDTLSDGLSNILATLLNKEVDGHRPDDIEEFRQAWFTDPSPGHHVAMQDIWYEHGIQCCHDNRGNTNCSADGKMTLSDITTLIDHVYINKKPLCCHEEGNVNASSDRKITMSDISRLLDFIYISKTPTEMCPGY